MFHIEIDKTIEAYLDGKLEREDRDKLLALADIDKNLAELIKLHQEINESIRDKDLYLLRNKIYLIVNERYTFSHKLFLRIAASILFLIAGILLIKLFFLHCSTGHELFEKYYSRYEPDLINRSSDNSSDKLTTAILFYESGNYLKCNQVLDTIILFDTSNYLSMFYKGLANIELHLPIEATKAFSRIPQDWKSSYVFHRDWYMALSLLASGNEKQAKSIFKKLIYKKNLYSVKSQIIIYRLKI